MARRAARAPVVAVEPSRGVDVRDSDLTRHTAACKALFLEIIRRAAYDYVLYRGSRSFENRMLADDAYLWLFVEDEQHARARTRREEGTEDCAFLSVCALLDLDPEKVRARVRAMTPRDVLMVGRLPLHRRVPRDEDADEPNVTSISDVLYAHRRR